MSRSFPPAIRIHQKPLRRLAEDADDYVKMVMANNPNCTSITFLIEYQKPVESKSVGCCKESPQHLGSHKAQDKKQDVKIGNKN